MGPGRGKAQLLLVWVRKVKGPLHLSWVTFSDAQGPCLTFPSPMILKLILTRGVLLRVSGGAGESAFLIGSQLSMSYWLVGL